MKKKLCLILLAIIVMTTFVGCGNKTTSSDDTKVEKKDSEDKVIKVGTDGSTPGFTVLNDKGELEGFEIDVWNEIASRTGYTVKFEQMPFSSLFGLLDDGRIDTVANCIGPTDARKEIYNFSDSYIYEEYVLLSRPDKNVASLKDLDGWSVGIVAGSTDMEVADYIEEKEGIKLERVNFDDTATNDVVMGKLDACVQSKSIGVGAMEKIGEDKIKVLIGVGLYSESAYPFARTERGDEIKELTNKTLKEMLEDGTLGKISEKWFNTDITQKVDK